MNDHEKAARDRKVEKLVAVLRKKHATLSAVIHVSRDAQAREAVEYLAGVRSGSDTTWQLVVVAFAEHAVADR